MKLEMIETIMEYLNNHCKDTKNISLDLIKGILFTHDSHLFLIIELVIFKDNIIIYNNRNDYILVKLRYSDEKLQYVVSFPKNERYINNGCESYIENDDEEDTFIEVEVQRLR